MLPPHLLPLPDVIAGVEMKAHSFGWGTPPFLLALFDRQLANNSPFHVIEAEVTPFTLEPASTPDVSIADVLKVIIDFVAETEAAPVIKTWLDGSQRTFLGIVLVSEGMLEPVAGSQQEQPSPALPEARIVTAIDLDGRHYQALRTRGEDHHRLTVDDTIQAEPLTGAIPHLLSRLVTAVQNL